MPWRCVVEWRYRSTYS